MGSIAGGQHPQSEIKKIAGLKAGIHAAIFGQEELVEEALCCLLAGGHLIMTGAPGLAKTTLVRVFSKNLGLQFGRIQFTPDLLPSDITGSELLHIDQETGRRQFEFSRGPVFANLLLADEINRASPRTQSALLEAMQERTVTVAGKSYVLPKPFMVFATQNPFESEGTFPLPEAQLDRFLIHSLVDYPSPDAEMKILSEHAGDRLIGESGHLATHAAAPDVSVEDLIGLQEAVKRVEAPETLITAVRDLVRSTRPEDDACPSHLKDRFWYGAGPRAGICLLSAGKALAFMTESGVLRWGHVKRLAKPVMRHRIRLSTKAMREGYTEDRLVDELIAHFEEKTGFLAKGI